jgi:hypothetical protein
MGDIVLKQNCTQKFVATDEEVHEFRIIARNTQLSKEREREREREREKNHYPATSCNFFHRSFWSGDSSVFSATSPSFSVLLAAEVKCEIEVKHRY